MTHYSLMIEILPPPCSALLRPAPPCSAPLTIQNALRLAGNNTALLPESILVLGLKYEPPNANLEFWRMECFALPKSLAGVHCIRTDIRQFLSTAEDAQKSLWTACSSFARDVISRGDKRPVSKKDISGFVEQMPVNSWYWSTLESRFHEVLREYTLDRDPDAIRCQWLKSVRDAIQDAWGQHSVSVSTGDAWAIRALVKAEGPVRRKVRELNDEISKFKPQKEVA